MSQQLNILLLIVLIVLTFLSITLPYDCDLNKFISTGDVFHHYTDRINNDINQVMNINDIQNCNKSIYRIYHNLCCIQQFTFNRLYSLGFTDFNYIGSDRRTKMLVNSNNSTDDLGCDGLDISANYQLYREQIPVILKTKLYQTIWRYCQNFTTESECNYPWLPKTYTLNDPQQRINFFKLLPCNDKANNEWILKNDAHKSMGITFIKSSNYVRSMYLTKPEQRKSKPRCQVKPQYKFIRKWRRRGKRTIAQEWISHPLKIDGCKFHIRSFVLLANYENPLILLYVNSIIIKALEPEAIITNRFVSKKLNQSKENDDWVWSMEQFYNYFSLTNYNITQLIEQMKDVIRVTFIASFTVNPIQIQNQFQHHYVLFAIDALITEKFNIKLLEINSRPMSSWIPENCIESVDMMENNWACKQGKEMMEELVDIEIEIAKKKLNGEKIETLKSIKNFQTVIWE